MVEKNYVEHTTIFWLLLEAVKNMKCFWY